MTTMYIAYNGNLPCGFCLGDQIVHIKTARMIVESEKPDRVLISLHPGDVLAFLWKKFVDDFRAEVIWDDWPLGNMDHLRKEQDKRRAAKKVNGIEFDVYRELYRRMDGADRQGQLAGKEVGLGRKNIFEYTYFGQEKVTADPVGSTEFDGSVIYHIGANPRIHRVFIAPHAKCQGNAVFTLDFWREVIVKLCGAGIPVTVNSQYKIAPDHDLMRTNFSPFERLVNQICEHKLVACGNTGIGWLAGATDTPLLAMQHDGSWMQDYRYEWCGVKSLIEFVREPDVGLVVGKIVEFMGKNGNRQSE